jgi:biotin transport system substrate-specific component
MSIAMPRMDRLSPRERGITLADFLIPIRVAEPLGVRVRHIALIVAGSLLIYLSARVVIPLGFTPVPITGQTFGVLLVGGALGFRRGFASVALYVLVGLVGVPFFAENKGGIDVILGATGGYLVGFIVAGAIVGRLAELGWDRNLVGSIAAMAIGSIVIYVIGVPWLAVVIGAGPAEAIEKGLTPFLVTDAIKLLAVAVVFPAAWWIVGRRPGDR